MIKFIKAALVACTAWLVLSSTAGAAPAKAEPELLDVDAAFQFSARLKDEKTIEVRYAIAPGYYMYRERFAFAVEGADAGPPRIPRGKQKFDVTFNKTMETFRKEVVVTISLKRAADGPIQIKATSQGCADAGVCYPPNEQLAQLGGASNASSTKPGGVPGALLKSPAQATAAPGAVTKPGALFVRVSNVDEVEQKVKAAGRLSLLDFYADWCAPCKQMERVTLADKRVRAKLAQFEALQADVTRNTLEDKLLLKKYKLVGPPGIVFFDKAGNEIPGLRVVGFEPPEQFLKTLDKALKP